MYGWKPYVNTTEAYMWRRCWLIGWETREMTWEERENYITIWWLARLFGYWEKDECQRAKK